MADALLDLLTSQGSNSSSEPASLSGGMPSYMTAAAVHDVSNGDTSFLDSTKKYLTSSFMSGANSFYNTGVAVGNWLGGDFEERDTYKWIQEYDNDTAKWYEENKAAADLTGFIVGSFIPGLGSTKLYNAGIGALRASEAGFVGANMSEATGLLIPKMDAALKLAKEALISPTSPSKWINADFQRALMLGAGEQAIQGTIQTTAIFATMGASPILTDMDVSDIGWNIALGGALQGVIGGVFQGAKNAGAVNKFFSKVDAELAPYIHYNEVVPGTSASDAAINGLFAKHQMKAVPVDLQVEGINISGVAGSRLESTISKLHDAVRTEIRSMATKGDDALGNIFADLSLASPEFKKSMGNLLGAEEFTRLGMNTSKEIAYNKAAERLVLGGATAEDAALYKNFQVKYLKNWGDDIGATFDSTPTNLSIADRLKPGEEIVVSAKGVKVGKENFEKFTSDASKPFSVLSEGVERSELRHMWANELDTFKPGTIVNAEDIPLLLKAVRETSEYKTSGILVNLGEGKGTIGLSEIHDLPRWYKGHVDSLVERMKAADEVNHVYVDPRLVERKLKELTGIPFKVEHKPRGESSGHTFDVKDSTKYQQITMNSAYFNRPLIDVLSTLKHEEGHTIFNVMYAEAMTGRHGGDAALINELTAISKTRRGWAWATAENRAATKVEDKHELFADAFSFFSKHPEALKSAPIFNEAFGHLVRPLPKSVMDALVTKTAQLDNLQISKALNMKLGTLERTAVDESSPLAGYSAIQSYSKEYSKFLSDNGLRSDMKADLLIYKQPQHTKIVYDGSKVSGLNGNVVEGMASIKERQRLAQDAADTVFTNFARELNPNFAENSELEIATTTRNAGTQGKISSANAPYGTTGSFTQYIGAGVEKLMNREKTLTREVLESPLLKLRMNDKAALEYSAIETKLRSTPEAYYLDEANSRLVLRNEVRSAQNAAEIEAAAANGVTPPPKYKGETLDPKAPKIIPIESADTLAVIKSHMSRNAERLAHDKNFKSVAGHMDNKDPRAFYAPPVDPEKYKHIAFVVDDSVTGTGHISMIYGSTPDHLDALIQGVKRDHREFSVVTKGESERFHKAMGDFKRDDTLSENYVNTALFRSGNSANFVPSTSTERIAQDLLDWHLQKDAQLARFAVVTKYGKEFNELRNMGQQYTDIATSKLGKASFISNVESAVKNPYNDLIKQALNITSTNEMPIWTAVNNFADQAWSKIVTSVSRVMSNSRGDVRDLDEINEIFKSKGVKSAAFDSQLLAWENHTAPKGALNSFVARSNAIMASLLLRLDPMNAVNNMMGSPILTQGEMRSVVNAIKLGNPEIAGKLAGVKLPGTGDEILSPVKLHANAIQMFFDPKNREWAKANGFSARHVDQLHSILDDLALKGTEGTLELNSKMKMAYDKFMSFAEKGEKVTGNAFAEEFNRVTSALMMKQLTDLGVEQGLMTEKAALTYVNTFVNRTQGNYMASQRPLMFQGAIGQAVGLFQTYQFNFAQQLLRHVAEGDAKTSALTLGLQGTIYGLNGMPAFQAMNTHIIGTMSGNKDHRDVYDAVQGIAGKDAGDFIMYGLPSNILGLLHPDLKFNLYTRGDINPRNLTIVPMSLESVPIVSAAGKLFGSMKETMGKVAQGGDVWPSILQGIEHSGLNRPLAGLAQTLEAFGNPNLQSYSTTNAGNLTSSNDLLSISNAVRITGARPLNEALVSDAAHRYQVYKAKDVAQRNKLGETIKTTVMLGSEPTDVQMEDFLHDYVKSGGKQREFNQFYMTQLKNANTAQANKIMGNLKSPHAESMQRLLGGGRFNDGSNLDSLETSGGE